MGNLISRVQNLIRELETVRMQGDTEKAGAARKGSARRTVRDDLVMGSGEQASA